jgi:hypothetical protein
MAAAGKDRRRRGIVTAGLLLAATALAGGPFTAGAVAKAAIKSAAAALPAVWLKMLGVLLPLTAVGTTLLMAHFLARVRSEKGAQQELACGLWLPWAVTLACVGLVVWFWPEAEMATRKALSPASIWPALWPVGLGVLLACGFCILGRKTGKRLGYRIPPGDLLTAIVWIAEVAGAWLSGKMHVILDRCKRAAAKFSVLLVKPLRSRGSISLLERCISTWGFAELFFLGTICVLYLLLALD